MAALKIIFAGSGAFGLPTLKALHSSSHTLLQVVSQPDRPAGRGKKLTPTPISQFAIDHHLPLARPEKIGSETLPPCDLLIVIAFGQKIPQPIVDHPRLGSINLHASLLPKYRGAAPINHAILNGETVTGNSVIRLAQKMDAGAVLAQSHLDIGPSETAGELHDRLSADGPSLILPLLERLADGTAAEIPQDESKATLAPKLSRETATIDWSQPAEVVVRRVNGLSPWPGCRVRLVDGEGKEIARATLVRARLGGWSGGRPGEISSDGSIAAGDQCSVEVVEIQPEGKRPMALNDFRNGHPWQGGMRVESIA